MLITSDNYPVIYDKIYRAGFLVQVLGILGVFAEEFASLMKGKAAVIGFPPATILFVLGVLISAWFLLVWDIRVKRFIVGSSFLGTLLMAAIPFVFPGGAPPILSALAFGLAAAGAAGLTGKEAYCFKFVEGWILMAYYPLLTLLVLFEGSPAGRLVYVAALGLWLLLKISFTIRKLRKPLMSCQAGKMEENAS